MLKVSSLCKSYGADPVLENISFVLGPGERMGLVGPNGSGKSTLLKLLAGDLRPDGGSVWLDPADRVAYLPQYPADELDLSVDEALLRGAGQVGRLQLHLAELENRMTRSEVPDLDVVLAAYAETREAFERLDGYALEARKDMVLQGLSLLTHDRNAAVRTLSGGNKTKLLLARLLLSGANVLLLDEPTNYLDLSALLWLERFVQESEHAHLIVSHDRRFLDRTVSSILELDGDRHSARQWAGGYSDYAEAKLREEEKRLEAYHDQQEEIARVREDIRRTKEQASYTESRTKSGMGADVQRRLAKKVAHKAKARERRLERQISGPDMIDKPRQGWGLHLADLGSDAIDDDRIMIEVRNLHAGYEGRPVLRGASLLVRGTDRVALLGENGSGKSTLLRCIAGAIPFEGEIRLGASVRLGLLSQGADELPLDRTVLEVFRGRIDILESDARTYLHRFLFSGQEVFKLVGALSYGQRAKLALAVLVLSDANFLVLDEPTSHMDMAALLAIERALEVYAGPLVLVSHDRYFIERIGINRVQVMDGGTLRPVDSIAAYEEELQKARALSSPPG